MSRAMSEPRGATVDQSVRTQASRHTHTVDHGLQRVPIARRRAEPFRSCKLDEPVDLSLDTLDRRGQILHRRLEGQLRGHDLQVESLLRT